MPKLINPDISTEIRQKNRKLVRKVVKKISQQRKKERHVPKKSTEDTILPMKPAEVITLETDLREKVRRPNFADNPKYHNLLAYVIEQAEKGVYPDITEWCRRNGITRDQANHWLVHQYTSEIFERIIAEKTAVAKIAVMETVLARRAQPKFAEIFLDYYERRRPASAQQGQISANVQVNITLAPPSDTEQ